MDAILDGSTRRAIRRKLLAWFERNARDLPWRLTNDAYKIWVSEIMLQQTQVSTVTAYFTRFVKRFPTVRTLARASEQEVLRNWEGLGYYRRARQLHRAAQVVVEEFGGKFPENADDVRSLPGIGRYTAGAILSIAFDQREPILEANTIRLLSRLSAFPGDPSSRQGQEHLWQFAEELLPANNAGAFNQGLMELGSEICSPRNPQCDSCPLRSYCPTNEQGLQDIIPRPKKKTNYEDVTESAVILSRGGKYLLRQCSDGERWAGMWDFPRFSTQASHDLPGRVKELTGLTIRDLTHWTTIKHGVTRFRITLNCYTTSGVTGRTTENGSPLIWITRKQLAEYPLSVTGRKISKLLASASST